MLQLPLISSRSASKSTYQRHPNPNPSLLLPSPPKQQSLVDKFQSFTKVTNYDSMTQPQIWKQYQKLRGCLKVLNQSVLEEIEKRQVVLRKESPKKKNVSETLNVVEEEIRVVQEAMKLSRGELEAVEGKLGYVRGLNVREMQKEYEGLRERLKVFRSEIRAMSNKTFQLSKNLTKGPSVLQKLSQSTSELQFLERRVYKQNNRFIQSKQILQTCLTKLSQLQKIEQQRQDQYHLFQQQKKQQDNIIHYQQLTTTKNDIEKYESPWKKNYLLKLKQLDGLVGVIEEGDGKVKEVELAILKIKGLIDSMESKTVVLRKQLKKEDMSKFNHSTMEMRASEPKTESEKTEDKCF